jgi:hypothetical protein
MPLVLLVLFVFGGLFLAISDNKKWHQNQDSTCLMLRKTNARLERELVNKCLLSGYSIEEAYEVVPAELAKRGFDLCMSPDSFVTDISPNYHLTIEGHEPIKYDSTIIPRSGDLHDRNSEAVKLEHKIVELQWKLLHPDEAVPEFSDEDIYKNFPKDKYDYKSRVDFHGRLLKMYPAGTLITIPGDGNYKILEIHTGDVNTRMDFKLYLLQNLATGEKTVRNTATKNITKI